MTIKVLTSHQHVNKASFQNGEDKNENPIVYLAHISIIQYYFSA